MQELESFQRRVILYSFNHMQFSSFKKVQNLIKYYFNILSVLPDFETEENPKIIRVIHGWKLYNRDNHSLPTHKPMYWITDLA